MTQHGSFPGRPHGRRARHQADVPEGGEYAAGPDEREFPDLSPIRPSQARFRDAGFQNDWAEEQAPLDQYGQPGRGYGQSGPGQAPWADQDWPSPATGGQPMAQQPQARHASPPSGPAEQPPQPSLSEPSLAQPSMTQAQSSQAQWAGGQQAKQEEDVPSWAEPDSVEAFSARWHRRGLDSRGDRRSSRRSRRRLLIAGGGVAAVAIAVGVYFLTSGKSNNSANLGLGSLVTQFLPGELQSVPNACQTVPSATLSQYLPGSPKQAAPPLNSGTNSQCSWTLDNPPTYRVLEVQLEAYTPSALVANSNGTGLVPAGNGSATYAAEAALASYDYNLVHPAAKSGQPAATVADLTGLPGGNDTSAFSATQVFERAGTTTKEATVYVRYRNVIVIAVIEGLDRTSGGKKYGPVTMSDLSAAAKTVARQVTSQIVH